MPDHAPAHELARVLRAEIQRTGPMPFARFMELALYDPASGYYDWTSQTLPKRACENGGIGRHVRLRGVCRKAWGFKSPFGYFFTAFLFKLCWINWMGGWPRLNLLSFLFERPEHQAVPIVVG